MKKILCLLLVFASVFSLTACAGKQDAKTGDTGDVIVPLTEPQTIEFWHCVENETQLKTLNTLTDSFNNGVGKEMGITVNLVLQGTIDDLASAVTAAIKSGDVPDLAICESEDVVQYLQTDSLVDLTPYVNDEQWGLNLDNYYEASLEHCRSFAVEGFYSVPFFHSGECLYYNVDFFNEHGLTPAKTWEEYETLCRTITSITGKPAAGWDEGTKCFTTLMEQYAGGYTDKEGKLLFAENMDTAVQKLSWYQGMVDEGIVRIPGEDFFFSGPFANQIVQMYIGSGGEALWINEKISKDDPFDWACAPVPQPANGDKGVFSEAWSVAMFDTEQDMEKRFASWIFLNYMQSEEAVMEATTHGAFLPFLKTVAESEEWKSAANTAQLAGLASMEAFYIYYAFDNGSYNTAGLKSDVAIMMDNILNAGADVKTSLETLVSTYQ